MGCQSPYHSLDKSRHLKFDDRAIPFFFRHSREYLFIPTLTTVKKKTKNTLVILSPDVRDILSIEYRLPMCTYIRTICTSRNHNNDHRPIIFIRRWSIRCIPLVPLCNTLLTIIRDNRIRDPIAVYIFLGRSPWNSLVRAIAIRRTRKTIFLARWHSRTIRLTDERFPEGPTKPTRDLDRTVRFARIK